MKTRFDVTMKSATEIHVTIFDVIGDGFFGGVSPKDVLDTIRSAPKAKQINVFINSPGGSVFDGVTIYNVLHHHAANVTVHVDGLAASAASLVAMAGDEILMADNAMMMIHDPWTITMGSASDIRKDAERLDKIEGTLVATYAARTGQTAKAVAAMMEAETWMTADEAVEMGFATEIVEAKKAAAFIGNPANFKNVPGSVLDRFEGEQTIWTRAAAALGLKGKTSEQPERKESAMTTEAKTTPAATAAPGLTVEQQAEVDKQVDARVAANTQRCTDIMAAIGDFPEIVAKAQADPAAGVTEAKAMGFDSAMLLVQSLTTKLGDSDAKVKAAAEAGIDGEVDTGTEQEDAPSAYEAVFNALVAGGMKPDDARMAVAGKPEHAEAHRAWLKSLQPTQREMPV